MHELCWHVSGVGAFQHSSVVVARQDMEKHSILIHRLVNSHSRTQGTPFEHILPTTLLVFLHPHVVECEADVYAEHQDLWG